MSRAPRGLTGTEVQLRRRRHLPATASSRSGAVVSCNGVIEIPRETVVADGPTDWVERLRSHIGVE